jgi:hypothetical protein
LYKQANCLRPQARLSEGKRHALQRAVAAWPAPATGASGALGRHHGCRSREVHKWCTGGTCMPLAPAGQPFRRRLRPEGDTWFPVGPGMSIRTGSHRACRQHAAGNWRIEVTSALQGVSRAFTEALPKSPATRDATPSGQLAARAARPRWKQRSSRGPGQASHGHLGPPLPAGLHRDYICVTSWLLPRWLKIRHRLEGRADRGIGGSGARRPRRCLTTPPPSASSTPTPASASARTVSAPRCPLPTLPARTTPRPRTPARCAPGNCCGPP